ncbi:hypothetical protein KCE64_005314 [Salmonella enterica subsp. enterica serovar Hvittingfoss]|nr:hypothetical protein [Salmonella enterica subsp. enterica serovar Hvittingfoss]EHL2852769.1 hypothetical protein [Salmonella enterica subsp. enterica serovar Hvittingfoss]
MSTTGKKWVFRTVSDIDDVTPGEYRPAVAAGNDWIKTRNLETVAAPSNESMKNPGAVAIDTAMTNTCSQR